MMFKKYKAELKLTDDKEVMLKKLSASNTDATRVVERSKILLMYLHGGSLIIFLNNYQQTSRNIINIR